MLGVDFMNGFGSAMSGKIQRLALSIGLAVVAVGGVRTIYPSASQVITMPQLLLNADNPNQRQVGALDFIAAWELNSRNDNFGGLSSLTAADDGRFIGVTDSAMLIGFTLSQPDQVSSTFIKQLPNSRDIGTNYKDRDSEGIAYDAQSKQFWISFEGHHAIRRYSASLSRVTGVAHPAEMQSWPKNKGAETIIRRNDGKFIVIAESVESGTHPALLFSGDPISKATKITAFRVRPPTGYRVTDASQLPDGRIILLNRSIGFPQGFSAKVSILDPRPIRSGVIVSTSVIASLASPVLIDNMEGIAVTKDGNAIYLWLISDNNFSIFQRTILMKFRLSDRIAGDVGNKKPVAINAPGIL